MKLIYTQGFSKNEKMEWKPVVFNNVVHSFRTIFEAMKELHVAFENPENEVCLGGGATWRRRKKQGRREARTVPKADPATTETHGFPARRPRDQRTGPVAQGISGAGEIAVGRRWRPEGD
jgi:hypothetical protein